MCGSFLGIDLNLCTHTRRHFSISACTFGRSPRVGSSSCWTMWWPNARCVINQKWWMVRFERERVLNCFFLFCKFQIGPSNTFGGCP